MPLETYTGSEIRAIMARVEADFGPDAVMVQMNKVRRWDGSGMFELTAGDADSLGDVKRSHLTLGNADSLTATSPAPEKLRRAAEARPGIIALVGPTGVGKTTTIAKLASNPRVFGGRRVGLISLDTYRVGAVEQLRTYAEIARIPLEVVHNEGDILQAQRRLNVCEVVLVDCPGWGPRNDVSRRTIEDYLRRINPDEVHLVLPVSMRMSLAEKYISDYDVLGVTHVLPTKLDELPDDWSLFDLAAARHYPMRWAADGQEVPVDIRPAGARLLASLARHTRATGGPVAVAG